MVSDLDDDMGYQDKLTSSSLPPLAASTLILTPSPPSSPLRTLVFNLNLIPCLVRIFCVALASSASMPGPPICARNSTTVTSVPNLDQTEAYLVVSENFQKRHLGASSHHLKTDNASTNDDHLLRNFL